MSQLDDDLDTLDLFCDTTLLGGSDDGFDCEFGFDDDSDEGFSLEGQEEQFPPSRVDGDSTSVHDASHDMEPHHASRRCDKQVR